MTRVNRSNCVGNSDPGLRAAAQENSIPWLAIAVSLLGIAATVYLLWHAPRKRQAEAAT